MTLAPDEAYHSPRYPQILSRPERRGVSRRSVIDKAKEIPTIDLADLLCGPGKMARVGERWIARCPLPGHEDHSPSFTVYLATNSWYCFGACQRGGDVVDLAAAAWGYEKHEAAMAAADLLREFGRPIPERPESWYRKQKRQRPVRNALEEARVRHIQRRLYRWLFKPGIERIEDEDERREEERVLREEAWDLALLLYEDLRARQGVGISKARRVRVGAP